MKKANQNVSKTSTKTPAKSDAKAGRKKALSGLLGEISEAAAKAAKNKNAKAKPARVSKVKKAKPPGTKSGPGKDKVERESVALHRSDQVLLKSLKAACLAAGVKVKKSELLRAGLLALSKLPASDLGALIGELTETTLAPVAPKANKKR